MNKHKMHHYWRFLRHIKARYFFAAALVCAVVCIFELRHNNQHMVELRQAVYVADENNGDVQTALNTLQAYVTAHMNTDLTTGNTGVYPPIQLQYTYQRLQEAQLQQVADVNANLYTDAQNYCQGLNHTDFSGKNRVPCIEQYVEAHGAKLPPAIPTSLYQFSFISPRWSPDAAGWTMVVTAVLLIVTPIVFFAQRHLKKILK